MSVDFLRFMRKLDLGFYMDTFGVFVSSFRVFHILQPLCYCGGFIYFVPCFIGGSPKFSPGLLCDCGSCAGKYSLCLLFQFFP